MVRSVTCILLRVFARWNKTCSNVFLMHVANVFLVHVANVFLMHVANVFLMHVANVFLVCS
jgi:hypothetical protein